MDVKNNAVTEEKEERNGEGNTTVLKIRDIHQENLREVCFLTLSMKSQQLKLSSSFQSNMLNLQRAFILKHTQIKRTQHKEPV